MIQYSLRCGNAHGFDSWFQSAAAYDLLLRAGQIGCPVCGDKAVEKTLMAPAVRPAHKTGNPAARPNLSEPQSELEAAMAELRRQVEKNSEYVGLNFVAEARRMHDGDIDQRPIYGEAKPDEARALIEDGVQVAPLPFLPHRKAN